MLLILFEDSLPNFYEDILHSGDDFGAGIGAGLCDSSIKI